jgi:hypothetical protein
MDDDRSSYQLGDKEIVAGKWLSVHGLNQFASIADGIIMRRNLYGDFSPALSTGNFFETFDLACLLRRKK